MNHSMPVSVSSNNFLLDRIMTEIRLSGHLEDVLIIIQKVEKKIPKYRDSFWYKFFLPGPSLLVKSIEDEFNLNPITRKLYKCLDLDKREIFTSTVIYCTTVTLGLLSIVAVIISLQGGYWFLVIILLCAISVLIQFHFFAHTIKHTGFVKIYSQICNVFENHCQEHFNYVKQVIDFPDQVQQRWQEMEKNKLFEGMSAEEKRHRQELELEAAQSLQGLAATVAISQAMTEAEIQEIKDTTQLKYRSAELNILNQFDTEKRQHEIALSTVESMGRCLVEQAKAVAKDSQERQKIEYQLHLLNGIRGKLQSSGSAAMADESLYDSINKMMEMMMNPIDINGKS